MSYRFTSLDKRTLRSIAAKLRVEADTLIFSAQRTTGINQACYEGEANALYRWAKKLEKEGMEKP